MLFSLGFGNIHCVSICVKKYTLLPKRVFGVINDIVIFMQLGRLDIKSFDLILRVLINSII